METYGRQSGMLGYMGRPAEAALWCVGALGYVLLCWWSLPRSLPFVLFILGLAVAIGGLAAWRPRYALAALLVLLPGITTVTITVFSLFTKPALGVFGPAALIIAQPFILGTWLRTIAARKEPAEVPLRLVLLLFMGLCILSAGVAIWRYTDFWPVRNVPYAHQVVNTEGLGAYEALRRILWALVNYLTGPLLLLAVCQAAAESRRRAGVAWNAQRWIVAWVLVPLFIGSAAPVLMGFYQTIDVWFGANKFYVWPWMNRINATFFDPNALGSYLILFAALVLSVIGLVGKRAPRTTLISVAAAVCVVGAASVVMRRADVLPWLPLARVLPDMNSLAWIIGLVGAWLVTCGLLQLHDRWPYAIPWLVLACVLLIRACIVLAAHAGSRTALFGMGVTLVAAGLFGVIFIARRVRAIASPRVFRWATAAIFLLYFAALVWGFYIGAPRARDWLAGQPGLRGIPLMQRIERLPMGSVRELYAQVMKDRGPYARLALAMVSDVPLTGVGLGTFVTELGNWKKLSDEIIYVPDTACNYYLQVAAEQGVIAFIVLMAIFALWWYHWWAVWQTARAQMFWLFIGAGMAGMMAAFVFGMHTLAHEILCTFWVYAALPLVVVVPRPRTRAMPRYTWLLALVIVVVYVCHAVSYLALDTQRQRFEWQKREGFYSYERWLEQGKARVRHLHQEAHDTLKCDGVVLRQSWACLHPDITGRPVRVTFAINDVVTNFMVGDNEWRETNLQVPWPYVGSFVDYHISADRTWSGAEFGLNSDTRQIGITIEDWSWLTTDGMQPEERWPQDGSPMAGVPFRWTAEHARMLVQCDEPYLRVPMLVTHPDVTSDPVYVSVTINSNRVADVEWQEPRWHDLVVFCGSKELRALPKDYVCLAFDVSRTWSPVFHGIADMRDLGVAVAEPEPVPSDGLYQRELWNNTFPYQWAARRARWAAQADIHGALDVTYLIDHPDLAQRPVTWRLTIDGRLAHEEVVTTSGWRTVTFDREPFTIHDLEAEVDRDWSPQDQGIDDARRLGFAIRRQSGNE